MLVGGSMLAEGSMTSAKKMLRGSMLDEGLMTIANKMLLEIFWMGLMIPNVITL
jgi:hypothetical protein